MTKRTRVRLSGFALSVAVLLVLVLCRSSFASVGTNYPPLDSAIDMSEFPTDFAHTADGVDLAKRLRAKEFLYRELKGASGKDVGATLRASVVVTDGFELVIAGLEDVLTVVIGQGEFQVETTLRQEPDPNDPDALPFYLRIELGEHPIALRLKGDALKPVVLDETGAHPAPAEVRPEIQLGEGVVLTLTYDWDGQPDFNIGLTLGGQPTLSLNTPVMVGDSGVVLDVKGATFDFSRTRSPGSMPPAWVGVAFEHMSVTFTNGVSVPPVERKADGTIEAEPAFAALSVSSFFLGTGGVTGEICGDLGAGTARELFGGPFTLEHLCVKFNQGALEKGEIAGTLQEFPFFDSPVRVALALAMDGNFKVSLAPPDTAHPTVVTTLAISGVMTYDLQALSIEKQDARWVWTTSGLLTIPSLSTDPIPINGLSVTSDGQVALREGWLVLPKKKEINFNSFTAEVAEIGFGTDEEGSVKRRWAGLSGGLRLSAGFDAAARFRKLQILWPVAGGSIDVRLAGVEVAFRKPGVLAISGSVDFIDDPLLGKGFAGSVACEVEAVKLSMTSRLVVGKTTSGDPFFGVDMAMQLPTPIVVYPNVGLFGFVGTFAYGLAPNLAAFTTPVDWFNAHQAATNLIATPPGYAAPPWAVTPDALALGAGVIIGTAADNGYTVNAKVALMVSMPGPVVMLQGAGSLFAARTGLTSGTPPPYTCLAVFDANTNTFLLNLGAYYTMPNVIDVKGQAEAFFSVDDPSNWHMWVGKDSPNERRVQALVLGFLKASSYLMVDGKAFTHGMRAGYDDQWKFGPLKVSMSALIGYDVEFFFRPFHVWGSADLRADVQLSACGVSIGLTTEAKLTARAKHPYLVSGQFKVVLKTPWPAPDYDAEVELRWEEQGAKDPVDELVGGIALEPRKPGPSIRPDVTHLSDTSSRQPPPSSAGTPCDPENSVLKTGAGDIACAVPLVPQDVVLSVAFQRPTNDPDNLGWGNPFDSSSPKVDTIEDTHFRYDLTSYELKASKKHRTSTDFDDTLTPLYAAWPALAGGDEPAGVGLRILSRNPLEIYEQTTFEFSSPKKTKYSQWAGRRYVRDYCKEKGGVEYLPPGADKTAICVVPDTFADGTVPEDFVLPPYSVFRLTVDGDVTRNDEGPDRIYRSVAMFHTEGPPLDLAPYVDHTIPPDERRPHFRGYDVGIRFDETYMNHLYARTGQVARIEVVDANDHFVPRVAGPVNTHCPWVEAGAEPAGGATTSASITTTWSEATDHLPSTTERDWLALLRAQGVPVDSAFPTDDMLFGRLEASGALRPTERHRARVWLEDDNLARDTRLTSSAWLAANPVRAIAASQKSVLLYEFPFIASRYACFNELVATYRGDYVERTAPSGASRAAISAASIPVGVSVSSFPSVLTNSNTAELGQFLRHALAPRAAADAPVPEQTRWLRRAPGYTDDAGSLTEEQWVAIRQQWDNAFAAFARVDAELQLETARQALPLTLELQPIRHNGEVILWLVSSPEALDVTRIGVEAGISDQPLAPVRIIPNGDGTRFFVVRLESDALVPWSDALWRFRFNYHRTVGSRYPALRAPTDGDVEVVDLLVDLPGDVFGTPG